MSGIYFHIPFCKSKCTYCDFYKTTDNRMINKLVSSLKVEMWLRKDYLSDSIINTIYFGGGTPSLLDVSQIEELIRACKSIFEVDSKAEITIEANPDDLSIDYLKKIRKAGVNRISIGVQSFSQTDLKMMKRRHNANQAVNAIILSREAGFDNISADLIYGLPNMPINEWINNLNKMFELGIQHLSAYHLTYHQGTRLFNDLKRGIVNEITEEESVKQFDALVRIAKENNFIHYEISNFAKEGYISRHNSSYWKQTEYLGLGPSAHSYNRTSRQWNVSSLTRYLKAIEKQNIPFQIERLSTSDRFNDYVITSLRTMWGIDLEYLDKEFGNKYIAHIEKIGEKYKANNQVVIKNNHLLLDKSCLLISDGIMSDFMLLN